MNDTITIDSFGPLPVERPASVADVCDLVKRTRAAKHGLYPIGGRTTLDFGLPPAKPGVACDTTALNAVIDYPARDMTVTVQAGVTVAALQAELAKEGQWLPIDVPSPERATLGGAVAVNASGPRRLGYGTLRDYVIGISFVTDDGVEVKAGGRVVKNVAGYDLMKLQIGALGTLGVITQLTLKVKPKPEASATVAFSCGSGAHIPQLVDLLHGSNSRPVAVQLVSPSVSRRVDLGTRAFGFFVGFEGQTTTVEWQVETLLAELAGAPGIDVSQRRGSEAEAVWGTLCALQTRPESRLIYKVSTLPSQVAAYFARSAAGGPDLIFAEALSGTIWFASTDEPTDETVARMRDVIDNPSGPKDGRHVTVRRCPTEWKTAATLWGTPPAGWELMRHVKRTLDPDDVFNPGRLFADR